MKRYIVTIFDYEQLRTTTMEAETLDNLCLQLEPDMVLGHEESPTEWMCDTRLQSDDENLPWYSAREYRPDGSIGPNELDTFGNEQDEFNPPGFNHAYHKSL